MTIHDPSLRAALKTLKLTGMLDTLDARLAQTRDGKLGHLEFLQVLCEDEIARRDAARPGRAALARSRRVSDPLRTGGYRGFERRMAVFFQFRTLLRSMQRL